MEKFHVRVATLPPMQVAYFKAFSLHPEMEASGTLWEWAEQIGLVADTGAVKRFGFNNPPPWDTSGPDYGYESWITMPEDTQPTGEIQVKQFPGSLCAVTTIARLADIGTAWEYLYQWVQRSQDYEHAHIDGLEEVLSPVGTPEEQLSFNLWLPIQLKQD
jgi:DNA gyrase inhibitor GyrI